MNTQLRLLFKEMNWDELRNLKYALIMCADAPNHWNLCSMLSRHISVDKQMTFNPGRYIHAYVTCADVADAFGIHAGGVSKVQMEAFIGRNKTYRRNPGQKQMSLKKTGTWEDDFALTVHKATRDWTFLDSPHPLSSTKTHGAHNTAHLFPFK